MATFEQYGALNQISDQSYRLVRNMRQNATNYISLANAIDGGTAPAGFTVAKLAAIMTSDATAFRARVDQVTAFVTRNQTLVQNAVAIIGETLASLNALKTTVNSAIDHTLAATLTTTQQCRDEATAILATVPSYDGVY